MSWPFVGKRVTFCTPPIVEGQPLLACHATLWRRHGAPIDLGTFGGLNSTAQNKGINNRDQVVGAAETIQPDPTRRVWSESHASTRSSGSEDG